MNILYVGDDSPASTSRHRADALRRLGHTVEHVNPFADLSRHVQGWRGILHYRTGYRLLGPQVRQWLEQQKARLTQAGKTPFDLCWVDGGELLGADVIDGLHALASKVVLFNHDDPTGGRDGARFNTFRAALPKYDLCVVVRPFNVDEFRALGARDVMRVFMTYDEVRHASPPQDGSIPAEFDNDVVFIGRNMNGEGRDLLLLALVQQGLKPAIWGDNWQRSAVWNELKPYWKGGSIAGSDYVNAMKHARICLGMLSKGNRDQHTTRTMEIPYAGGLLCAERTDEHQALYAEDVEAVFWATPEECAAKCKALLADPQRIAAIKRAGHARVIHNQVGNEDVCRAVLSRLAHTQTPMQHRVFVFDSHPVQYKAPVYQALERTTPGLFEVIYASDASVKGYKDIEFGVHFAWDTPLMDGYTHRVLNNENPDQKGKPAQYHGKGIYQMLKRERPAAVMLTQSHYHFDHAAYFSALRLGIPILIRQETQDATYAQQRSVVKSTLRNLAYRAYYAPARHFFVFGKLNQTHLLAHGVSKARMSFARFSVPDPLQGWATEAKQTAADAKRSELGVAPGKRVLGFFGKLIPKKHPDLIFDALDHLPAASLAKLELMFVGAGELEPMLRSRAEAALQRHGVRTHFTGFINQSHLPGYYLATDLMVLPSRHLGEAWGLVVNEALQAGCAVAITDGVGCHVEFGQLARVKVSPVEDAAKLAASIAALIDQPRDFDWARDAMATYSTEAAAKSLHAVFKELAS